ncbi:uncharacterized protein LOC129218477 [Uloborus diversus]|uniref:uncharacterized protein LOC129218477 n=1 Tax=Uloborus diversus TaxID=327109 RepID=UPI00240925B0|nr:uncharacterized protein LOC129218477 [Uloborus diversus]
MGRKRLKMNGDWPTPWCSQFASFTKEFIPTSLIVIFLFSSFISCDALDCFKCVSVGGDNKACEDPFHNNYTSDILEAPCWAGRKQRDGVFPATACIKLSGIYEDTGQKMVVRGCALDSGTLTIDTEIVRMSHCGGFYFDDRYVSGCLQSCSEDACNTAQQWAWPWTIWLYLLWTICVTDFHHNYLSILSFE